MRRHFEYDTLQAQLYASGTANVYLAIKPRWWRSPDLKYNSKLLTSVMVELLEIPKAQQVVITDDALTVDLSDGRTISVPLAWYPRLLHGTLHDRANKV